MQGKRSTRAKFPRGELRSGAAGFCWDVMCQNIYSAAPVHHKAILSLRIPSGHSQGEKRADCASMGPVCARFSPAPLGASALQERQQLLRRGQAGLLAVGVSETAMHPPPQRVNHALGTFCGCWWGLQQSRRTEEEEAPKSEWDLQVVDSLPAAAACSSTRRKNARLRLSCVLCPRPASSLAASQALCASRENHSHAHVTRVTRYLRTRLEYRMRCTAPRQRAALARLRR